MSLAENYVSGAVFSVGRSADSNEKASALRRGTATPTESLPNRRHRIAEVRRQQGVSVRSAARRMGVPMQQVRAEERPDSDLKLSDLARWERALEVPLSNLLVDDNAPLSEPVMKRAKWLRLMKTIKALVELNASPAATRMAQMLEQQVVDVAPEMADVGAWHSVGQRRTQDEMGRVVENTLPRTFARDGLR
ncbi:helix-turn-helix transcriptional regulator [Botrimarina sp.]|uniref:helix-turn-helix domain-containing protein n=1 Tax=Botrimarina sp. TaxID=2795802 RepID=UPI0032EF51A8